MRDTESYPIWIAGSFVHFSANGMPCGTSCHSRPNLYTLWFTEWLWDMQKCWLHMAVCRQRSWSWDMHIWLWISGMDSSFLEESINLDIIPNFSLNIIPTQDVTCVTLSQTCPALTRTFTPSPCEESQDCTSCKENGCTWQFFTSDANLGICTSGCEIMVRSFIQYRDSIQKVCIFFIWPCYFCFD